MSWNRRLSLYVDVDAPYGRTLLTGVADTSLLNIRPTIYSGDHLPVRVHFLRRNSNPSAPAEATDPGDSIITLSAKGTGDTVLFQTSDFTEIETGVWEAPLNLNTNELIAALAASPSGPKSLLGEIEIASLDGTDRFTLQFDLDARPQVYAGGNPPDPADPPYPTPLSIVTKPPEDGQAYIYSDGAWHILPITIAPGWKLTVTPEGLITTDPIP